MQNFKLIVAALFMVTACATAVKVSSHRGPQSSDDYGGAPRGLSGQDAADFEHLAEGSEIYPYEWMRVLKSPHRFIGSDPFLSGLDTKYGLMVSHNRGHFLMPYVGMTAAWSNHPPTASDAFDSDKALSYRKVLFRELDNNVKSIRMVGTNCAMCHNGEVTYKGVVHRIDGAPAITNIRGYFEDLAKSTITLLAKKDVMAQFLTDLGAPQNEAETKANEITTYFLTELGAETHWNFMGHSLNEGKVSGNLTLALAALLDDRSRMYNGKNAIGTALEKLLRASYGFNESDNIGELHDRMMFLGTLMVGTNPKSQETSSGYGRTDAFGRIGNLVLRDPNSPAPYTAPVSLPWIWGIKYSAMLHYTANTNSVMLRNFGQSLGLGAVILNSQGDSTINAYNLDRLENLVHKIKVPQWSEVFAKEISENNSAFQIKTELASRGEKIYEQRCQKCHEAKEKVGPQNALYNYQVKPLNLIGTDEQCALNIVKPVRNESFRTAILAKTEVVKARYYERNSVSAEQQAQYEFRGLRGTEFFRDTLNGFSKEEQKSFGNNYGEIAKGSGYVAHHLSGVWATGPYLHDGSVPTLWDLLQPASKRPKYFDVQSHEFDPVKLGYVNTRKTSFTGQPKPCDKNEEPCFDTTAVGNSNKGHEGLLPGMNVSPFGTDLNDSDKAALLEYLKVLPPEPEYGW